VGLDKKAEEDILGVEGKIYKRTNVSSTGLDKKIRMEVDALDHITGRVLSIKYEDGK